MPWLSRKTLVVLALAALAHAGALAWLLASPGRRSELVFDSAFVDLAVLQLPPAELGAYGYEQDRPEDVRRFRSRAEAATAGATTDLARIGALTDSIYRLRQTGRPVLAAYTASTLDEVAAAVDQGIIGQCGHITWLVTGMARSLAIDTRQIVWARDDGTAGHVSLEVYSRDAAQWIYFDVNLNGYAAAEGRPLSALELRERTSRGEDVEFVSTSDFRNWTEDEFARVHAAYSFDWHLMSNRLEIYTPGRRFGPLHDAYDLFMRLPYGGRRAADRILTGSRSRLAVSDAPPASSAASGRALFPLLSYLVIALGALAALAIAYPLIRRTG